MVSNIEAKLGAIGIRYDIVALYAFGSRAAEIAGWVREQKISP